MRRLLRLVLSFAACVAAGLLLAGGAAAQTKEVLIGGMCDRTGPTQINGVGICPGIQDYYELVNSKGGVEGYRIKYMEIDHEYKVPQGMEAYQKEKGEGAVAIMVYGTPQVQALNQTLTEDKIPGTSPGFGIAASADGKRFPYLFPIAATYWSQGAAAIQFAKEKLGGTLDGKKLAYLFYDNPAGREPLPVIEDLQKIEKFELRTFAVPPPGVEMGAQVLDISQRYKPDFVIAHLFGRSPSLAIKEFKRVGLDEVDYIFCLNSTEQHMQNMADVIKPQGKLCLIVETKGPVNINPFQRKSVAICWELMFTRPMFETFDMQAQHDLLSEVAGLVESGTLRTTKRRSFGKLNAESLRQAHRAIEKGDTIGKITLTF